MNQARIAGGNYSIAGCGHVVLPEQRSHYDASTRESICTRCAVKLLRGARVRGIAALRGPGSLT